MAFIGNFSSLMFTKVLNIIIILKTDISITESIIRWPLLGILMHPCLNIVFEFCMVFSTLDWLK